MPNVWDSLTLPTPMHHNVLFGAGVPQDHYCRRSSDEAAIEEEEIAKIASAVCRTVWYECVWYTVICFEWACLQGEHLTLCQSRVSLGLYFNSNVLHRGIGCFHHRRQVV